MSFQIYSTNDPENRVFIFNIDNVSTSQSLSAIINSLYKKCSYIEPIYCINCDTMIAILSSTHSFRDAILKYNTSQDILNAISSSKFLFITYTIQESFIEIFIGLCDSNDINSLKYIITSIINYYVDKFQVFYIYAPVTLPHISNLFYFLIANKFKNIEATTTNVNKIMLNVHSIRAELDITDPMVNANDYSKFEDVYHSEISNIKSCVFKIQISSNVLDYIKQYLNESVEYAGSLVIAKYTLEYVDGKLIPVAHLVFAKSTLSAGSSENVITPTSMFNFHTHPYHCYVTYNCALGWPSDQDMATIVFFRNAGNIVHFVITAEGVYSVQFTSEFSLYFQKIKDKDYINFESCFYYLQQSIKYHFSKLLAARQNVEDKSKTLKMYLDQVNSYTIQTVTEGAEQSACHWLDYNANFKVFNVIFKSWEDIYHDKKFSIISTGIINKFYDCPPSINTDIDLLDDEFNE